MKQVTIYTDGACSGNPGPGGWAAILLYEEHEKVISGGAPDTTNNQMELMAAIKGLEALKVSCEVKIHSDSEYVVLGMKERLPQWKAQGWRTAGKKPIANKDLWQRLEIAAGEHEVTWHWDKGHAGNEYNERCDKLARAEIEKHRK